MLGANDGLVSTASLMIGVAAASSDSGQIVTAGVAGLFAGALSMAAGEYVSVSSQRDAERADLATEKEELAQFPDAELRELTDIYERRGLSRKLASDVAIQLHENDPLEAHLRDELGLDPDDLAQPLQAAVVSATAFSLGSLIPLIMGVIVAAEIPIAAAAMVGLVITGVLGARLGGARWQKGAARVVALGAAAMAITAVIGSLVGAAV